MKKLLIALAALAVLGTAQAESTIYGLYNVTIDNTKTGTASGTGSMYNDLSRIGFTTKEDLGGGLTSRIVIETSLMGNTYTNAPVGTQIGDRQATGGVAGKLGSIDLGRNVHSEYLALSNNDVFGTKYGSIASDVHNLRGLRMSGGVFAVATPMPGVVATYDRTYTGQPTEYTAYSLGGTIAGINIVGAHYDDSTGLEKSDVLGVNTTFGNTTIAYSGSDNKSVTVGETKRGSMIGLSQKIGQITAKASYGKTNTSVTAYNVGAEYALSKRTDFLVSYRKVDAAGAASDVKQIGFGMTHRF
jgi:predicted porin